MSHADTILQLILAEPGLTDRQLSQHTGITPVQQVNSICRRLAAAGVIDRTEGINGVVNLPAGDLRSVSTASQPVAQQSRPTTSASPRSTKTAPMDDATAWTSLLGLEPARTLMVIPCSARKLAGGATISGSTVTDALPAPLTSELLARRADIAQRARLDTSTLRPAWQRYTGGFYVAAHEALVDATQRQAHLVILSGGYGLVAAQEPIGEYEAPMKTSWWPNSVLGRCLIAYAQAHGLTSVVAFLAGTSDYAKVMRRASWAASGIAPAILVSPDSADTHGAMTMVPRVAGEAFSAFWRGALMPDWSSTQGLRLRVELLL